MTEEEETRLLKAFGIGTKPKRSLMERAGEVARDVGKTIESGVTRGLVGTPGAPADIARFGQMARDYVRSTNIGGPSQGTYDDIRKREDERRERESYLPPSTLERFGSQNIIDQLAPMSGGALTYKPTTAPGRAVALPAEMAGGAVGGAGLAGVRGARALASTALRSGVVPGAAVVGAQALGVENPVALGALGIAAGAGAEGARTRSAPAALQARTRGATEAQLQEAEALFQQAQRGGMTPAEWQATPPGQRPQPIPLSRANALDFVTGNATSASGLQRVVEGQGQGMGEFYANPAERIQAAGGRALDAVGPVADNPSTLGPRAAERMQENIAGTEMAVNAATRPAYQQFQDIEIPPGDFAPLLQNPLFMAEHQRVFADPRYAHLTQGVAPDSVQGVDITRRILRDTGQAIGNPTNPNRDPTAATGYRIASDQAQEAASAGSRQGLATGQGQPSPLEATQQAQAQLREQFVDPLVAGPEGKVARSTTTEGAQAEVFPQAPRENAHAEVGRMVSTLSQNDPVLASEFVRNYLGSAFAQAQDRGMTSANRYYSAPAFWSQIAGNPEQAASLQAALGALPNGPARAQVFNDTMRIFDAMGQRERIGSQTAFNAETIRALREAGMTEGAIKLLGGGGIKLPQKILDRVENWRLGRNVDELASLFTDPARGAEFARIASAAPGSAHWTAQLLRTIGSETPGAATVGAPVSAETRADEERSRRAGGASP